MRLFVCKCVLSAAAILIVLNSSCGPTQQTTGDKVITPDLAKTEPGPPPPPPPVQTPPEEPAQATPAQPAQTPPAEPQQPQEPKAVEPDPKSIVVARIGDYKITGEEIQKTLLMAHQGGYYEQANAETKMDAEIRKRNALFYQFFAIFFLKHPFSPCSS